MDLRVQKARATLLYLILIGTLILSASLFVYSLISRHLLQANSPTDAILLLMPFYQQERIAGVRAAVLQSQQTAAYFASSHEDPLLAQQAQDGYLELARSWRQHLLANQIEVDIISDEQLLTSLYRYNVLIVPMAHCLADAQISAIKNFLSERKGVILTHMAGNRDESGQERPWSLTSDVTGSAPSYRHARGPDERLLYLHASTPLTAGVAPGFALPVRTYDQPIELVRRDRRAHSAGIWQAEPHMMPTGDEPGAGMLFGEYLGGRFVWFGFNAQAVAPTPETWNTFSRIIDNAIDWTSYRPIVGKAPWPSHHMAAAVGIMPQQNIAQAHDLQQLIASRTIRPGYFTRPDDAPINRPALEQLREKVEFAARITALPAQVAGGIDNELHQTIQTSQAALSTQFEADVPGITLGLEPTGGFDRLARNQVEYIWLHNQVGFTPKVAPLTREPLFGRLRPPVLIPQGARPDNVLIEEQGLGDPDLLLNAMKRDVDRVNHFGGLYTITLHAHLIGAERYRQTVADWLRYLQAQDAWITSPAEVARWWRKQANISVRLVDGRRRLTVLLSNEGSEPVQQMRIWIYPPQLPDNIDIGVERIRTPIPEYRIDKQLSRIELVITDLGRRENRTYFLDF